MIFASDHANPPPPGVLKAAGMIAANVYVSGRFAQDAAHVKALRDAGIGPWPNYERGLWELIQAPDDRAAGRAAGTQGIADAIRCSFPANGTIWFPFSVDVDLDPTRYHEAADAFRGIQDVNQGRYLISCYGQGGLIKYLRAEGVLDQKGWLSASTGFPGYDPASPDICVYQEIGSYIPGYSIDRNIITDVHALHAWWPTGSPYATQEDDLTPDEKAQLAEVLSLVKRIDFGLDNGGTTPFQERGEIIDRLRSDVAANAKLAGQVAGLMTAISTLAGGSVDLAAVTAAAKAGAQSALDGATIQLTPGVTP